MANNYSGHDPIIYGVYTNIGEYCLYVGTAPNVAKYLNCSLNSFYSKITHYKNNYTPYNRNGVHIVRLGKESEL